MARWRVAMPDVILDVPYARWVREPEAMAREILACGDLAWEPDCVDLTRNRVPSATLGMAQVTRTPKAARSASAIDGASQSVSQAHQLSNRLRIRAYGPLRNDDEVS